MFRRNLIILTIAVALLANGVTRAEAAYHAYSHGPTNNGTHSGYAHVEWEDMIIGGIYTGPMWTWGQVYKQPKTTHFCAELWHNTDMTSHRAPDVFVNCETGWKTYGGFWMPTSTANGPSGYEQIRFFEKVKGSMLCIVDPLTWIRVVGQNCTPGPSVPEFGQTRPELHNYTGKSWQQLKSTGADGPGGWNIPGIVAGDMNSQPPTDNVIERGSSWPSYNGEWMFAFQTDGNLVQYDLRGPTAVPVWASDTGGNYSAVLKMQSDGNVVIYNPGNDCIFHTGTNGQGIIRFDNRGDGFFGGQRQNGSWVGFGRYWNC